MLDAWVEAIPGGRVPPEIVLPGPGQRVVARCLVSDRADVSMPPACAALAVALPRQAGDGQFQLLLHFMRTPWAPSPCSSRNSAWTRRPGWSRLGWTTLHTWA